jgi:hypothetical protein
MPDNVHNVDLDGFKSLARRSPEVVRAAARRRAITFHFIAKPSFPFPFPPTPFNPRTSAGGEVGPTPQASTASGGGGLLGSLSGMKDALVNAVQEIVTTVTNTIQAGGSGNTQTSGNNSGNSNSNNSSDSGNTTINVTINL